MEVINTTNDTIFYGIRTIKRGHEKEKPIEHMLYAIKDIDHVAKKLNEIFSESNEYPEVNEFNDTVLLIMKGQNTEKYKLIIKNLGGIRKVELGSKIEPEPESEIKS